MEQFYEMIYKRKSVRHYDGTWFVSEQELEEIRCALNGLKPLLDIPVSIRIVKREETTCMWGEYCLMAYSEPREGYLLNIGYLEEDMVYINRAMYLTDYTLYDDNSKPRKISAKKAKEILGQEGFLSGLARSTFHHDASRENVFFNSSRYHYCDGIVL